MPKALVPRPCTVTTPDFGRIPKQAIALSKPGSVNWREQNLEEESPISD